MKTLILTIIFIGNFSFTIAQTLQDIIIKKKANDTIIDIDTITGARNRKLICQYDTLYIINKYGVSAFENCINSLARVKNLSGSLNALSGNFSSIQSGVNSMDLNMRTLTDFVKNYEAESKQKLEKLEKDNDALTKSTDKIKADLADAQKKLNAEKWKDIGTKTLWSVGGFAVGGLLFTSLFLLK